MRWLLVGAMRAETTPLLRLLQQPRPRSHRLVVGQHGEHQLGVLTCGVGPDKARERTTQAVARFSPDRVLNLGTCGSLVDAHGVGAVLHVDRLLDDQGELGPLQALGLPAVGLVTVRSGVWDPDTRNALAARGAGACEMEAAGVLAGVGERPLHVVKVVSDRAGAEPDAVIPAQRRPGARPGPVEVARFKARALRLVESRLLPVVRQVLAGSATG